MVSLKWNFLNLIRIPQTWNCFIVISIFLLAIDDQLIDRFTDAAFDGDFSLLKELLDNGMPVDREYAFFGTVLICAAMKNRTDVTLLLLDRGADVNKRSGVFQSTALHEAARYNSTDVIKVLLKHSASTNIKNRLGSKPIDVARANNNEAAVRLLEWHY